MMRSVALIALTAACAPAEPDDPTTTDTASAYFPDGGFLLPDTEANVVRAFGFTQEEPDGVAQGFDLDGITSPADDPDSCGHGDLEGPNGEPGIDNQLAALWGIVAPLVGEQVEELLQGSINEGRMLMMIELEGLDDPASDDDLSLRIFRGAADPLVGTAGLITPDQTYAIDASVPVAQVDGIRMTDHALDAGPVAFDLPIDILEASFNMHVTDGRIALTMAEDGTMSGILGGIVDVRTMIDELLATDAAEEAALVAPIFENNADLWNDSGTCTGLSVAFTFQGTRAFVVRQPE